MHANKITIWLLKDGIHIQEAESEIDRRCNPVQNDSHIHEKVSVSEDFVIRIPSCKIISTTHQQLSHHHPSLPRKTKSSIDPMISQPEHPIMWLDQKCNTVRNRIGTSRSHCFTDPSTQDSSVVYRSFEIPTLPCASVRYSSTYVRMILLPPQVCFILIHNTEGSVGVNGKWWMDGLVDT